MGLAMNNPAMIKKWISSKRGEYFSLEMVGKIKKWERHGHNIIFLCSSLVYKSAKVKKALISPLANRLEYCGEGRDMEVSLTFYTPEMFRMEVAYKEGISYKKTPMVVGNFGKPVKIIMTEQKDNLTISTLALNILINKKSWRMHIEDTKRRRLFQELDGRENVFKIEACPLGYVSDLETGVKFWCQSFRINFDEHFYGFGEKFGRLDKRGQTIAMWMEDGFGNCSIRSYKNIPFFMSTRGYGIFVNSTFPMKFDMGDVCHIGATFEVVDKELDYYFIYGPTLKKILRHYTDLTGKSPLPPKWSFGLWMSQCSPSYRTRKEVERLAARLRKERIPCDVINIDIGWLHNGKWEKGFKCDLRFNESRFSHPEEMLKRLKEKGIKICLWHLPFINFTSTLYREGAQKGYFALGSNGGPYPLFLTPVGENAVIDFSNPEAVKWYQGKLKDLFELGVACMKVDFGEDNPPEASYFSYSGLAVHNLYPLLYNQACFEENKDFYGEGLIWARSAYSGSQRYPVHWSGDATANFPTLASCLRGGLSFGLSGFTYWSHDIGAISDHEHTPALYIRWAQFGLFSSHSRCHGTKREPWHFGKEALRIFRKFDNLRYRLLPYIYTQSKISGEKGLPLLRALVLEYQDDPATFTIEDQYMFGDSLLIAPILAESDTRKIYLPEGEWVDWWDKKVYQGQQWINYTASLNILPLFVKKGNIIPLGPEMQYVAQKPTDPITWEIFLGEKGEAKVIDGINEWKLSYRVRDNRIAVLLKEKPILSLKHIIRIHLIDYSPKIKIITLNGKVITSSIDWKDRNKCLKILIDVQKTRGLRRTF